MVVVVLVVGVGQNPRLVGNVLGFVVVVSLVLRRWVVVEKGWVVVGGGGGW